MPLPRPSGTRHHRSRCAIHPSGTRARLPRHTADLRQMALDGLSNGVAAGHGVRIDLEGDAYVSARDRQHVCVEVPVADDEVTKPTAVEVAALGGQGQQGRVDEQFLDSVTDVAGGNVDADPLLHSDVLTATGGRSAGRPKPLSWTSSGNCIGISTKGSSRRPVTRTTRYARPQRTGWRMG